MKCEHYIRYSPSCRNVQYRMRGGKILCRKHYTWGLENRMVKLFGEEWRDWLRDIINES